MRVALLLAAVLTPLALRAQETPPAGLAAVEVARSQACVAALGRLEDLNTRLEPFAVRMERLRALGRAVSLEDRAEAGEMEAADSVAQAVARWFVADSALAARYLAQRDTAIQEERTRERNAILDLVRGTMEAVAEEAQGQLGDAAEIEAAAAPCEAAILVRAAVVETCAGAQSLVCRQAAAADVPGPFRFVESPEDLWDVEDFRPWSSPTPLQGTPQGALVGGRTVAQARRANVTIGVALAPMLRNRADLGEEEAARFQANLDSLGFTFEHPLLTMAPALDIQAAVPAPIGGETHILVHFGDLSGDDIIWSTEVGAGGVFTASVPATAAQLARLAAGEPVSLTAVKVPEDKEQEADAVYSVSILTVNQVQSTTALLEYMRGGALARDLAALVQPPPAG